MRLCDHQLGMKAVGNGRENTLTIPTTVFFMREREREREGRSGKRNRKYEMSETIHFDQEKVNNDRESVIQIGNVDAHNHFNHST